MQMFLIGMVFWQFVVFIVFLTTNDEEKATLFSCGVFILIATIIITIYKKAYPWYQNNFGVKILIINEQNEIYYLPRYSVIPLGFDSLAETDSLKLDNIKKTPNKRRLYILGEKHFAKSDYIDANYAPKKVWKNFPKYEV